LLGYNTTLSLPNALSSFVHQRYGIRVLSLQGKKYYITTQPSPASPALVNPEPTSKTKGGWASSTFSLWPWDWKFYTQKTWLLMVAPKLMKALVLLARKLVKAFAGAKEMAEAHKAAIKLSDAHENLEKR
jgi:hypothetical protein